MLSIYSYVLLFYFYHLSVVTFVRPPSTNSTLLQISLSSPHPPPSICFLSTKTTQERKPLSYNLRKIGQKRKKSIFFLCLFFSSNSTSTDIDLVKQTHHNTLEIGKLLGVLELQGNTIEREREREMDLEENKVMGQMNFHDF